MRSGSGAKCLFRPLRIPARNLSLVSQKPEPLSHLDDKSLNITIFHEFISCQKYMSRSGAKQSRSEAFSIVSIYCCRHIPFALQYTLVHVNIEQSHSCIHESLLEQRFVIEGCGWQCENSPYTRVQTYACSHHLSQA